jgi:hypothetical protein
MSAAAVTPAPAATARAPRVRSALWPLAHAEGRRLVRHPLFLLGMAATITFAVIASGELVRHGIALGAADSTEIANFLAGDVFVMLGAAFWTFLATFLAASRERRDAAGEFYAGQPVSQSLRTAAALLSLAYAGLAALAVILVATVVLLGPDRALTEHGMHFSVRPIELLQGPLYVVMAGALGVLLGTWTRHVSVGLLAAVALFLPPIALVPWFVLDDNISRGFYGAFSAGWPVSWHMLIMAGVVALAASLALARSYRRPRLAFLAGAGLGAVVAFAIASPTVGLASGCNPDALHAGPVGVLPTQGDSGNLNFERGDLSGWGTHAWGPGGWRAYSDPTTPPDSSISDPRIPFDVTAPPQGRFAAVLDMCGPGTRLLYRDLKLDGPQELRFELYYHSFSTGFSSVLALSHVVPYPNRQLRVDIVDPAAPLHSTAAGDVLDTVFRTTPGDPPELGPKTVSSDLSKWAGRTVRIRFAEVDNNGPLRVVVDDVRLDPAH